MSLWSARWLRLGEWLLNKRWWVVLLASLSVFSFEFVEYHPFQGGLKPSFFLEISFYGIALPLSVGLALTWAALTHTELAWSTYYKNLTENLDVQLHNARSYNELAMVLLQFMRVVIPVIGVVVYKHEQNNSQLETVLSWSSHGDLSLPKSDFACASAICPFLPHNDAEKDALGLGRCQDPNISFPSQEGYYCCLPFLFSNSLIAGARLYFQSNTQFAPEQIRLLKEITPGVAAAFYRIQLEQLMKKHEDGLCVEQQRIARDVHDSLGHNLAYLRLRLDQISMEFNSANMDALHQEVEVLRDVAKEAYDQMRDVLTILTLSNDEDFNETFMEYAQRIRQRSNLRLRIHNEGEPRTISTAVQRNCFLIFKEIMTNIEKHAQAQVVQVKLNWQDTCFIMDFCDDGVGFDVNAELPDEHFGLKNIRERASDIHAQMDICSQPGQGTHITIHIPYENGL